jgi:ubiquinone/menaquinone biosynthesis C-methylase UbiE
VYSWREEFWGRHNLFDSDEIVKEVLNKINLAKGFYVADLGSGTGRFTIPLAKEIGENGKVFAVDISKESLTILKENADREKLNNIEIVYGDISKKIPLDDNSIDVAFMANVFHDILYEGNESIVLSEIKRILKNNGRLIILEFKKIRGPPGPPIFMRISHDELINILNKNGFSAKYLGEIGKYHYLIEARI